MSSNDSILKKACQKEVFPAKGALLSLLDHMEKSSTLQGCCENQTSTWPHVFQKAQVTLNKNAYNFQHHFGAQFFKLFHMVWFILFGVLGRETTFSLVEVLQQPIRNFHFKVFRANTRNKMDHIMWKSMKNCAQKWCRSLCAFLFEATYAFGKMCK